MKNKTIIFRIVIFRIAAVALLTLATMLLWNWLMPTIFSLTSISSFQAFGLLVLSRILFGGMGNRHGGFKKDREHFHKRRFKKQFFGKERAETKDNDDNISS